MKKKNCLKGMQRMLSKKNMVKIAEIDFCVGEDQKEGNGLSDGWQQKLDGFLDEIS